MPLMRTYGRVKEGGRVFIPGNFRRQIGLNLDNLAIIEVVRIKNTKRAPHLLIHIKGCPSWISLLEEMMRREVSHMDQEGDIILSQDVLEEARLKPGYLVEMKIAGPNNGSWLVIRNRGPKTLTTLQEKVRRYKPGYEETKELKKAGKTWRSMPLDY